MNTSKKIISFLILVFAMMTIISLSVFATEDTRIEVSEFVATSDFVVPTYNAKVKTAYNFTFTTGTQAQAYSRMSGWNKWNEEISDWERYSDSRFSTGKYQYFVQIRIDSDSGYGTTHKLAKTATVTVDGAKWNYSDDPMIDKNYSYTYIYSPTYTVNKKVNSINVSDLNKPAEGTTPDTTVTTESTFKIGAFKGINWYTAENGLWKAMENGESFEAGKTYKCYLQIFPTDGHIFPDKKDEFSVTINNESAVVVDYNSKLVYVEKEYRVSCKIHNYDTIDSKQATCTEDGYTNYECTVCGKTKSVTDGSTGHSYYETGYKDATCGENGYTEYKCTRCGNTKKDTINATGNHTGGSATCKTKAICTVCDASYGEVDANNHKSLTTLKAVAATCTKEGKTEGKKCSVCGTVTVAQKAVAKKAHTYKNVTTKATLTKNGKVENKCSVCGNVSKTTTVYYPKTIKLSATKYTYNGKVQTPTVTVKDSKGNTLKKDTDYTVKYASGRKNTGKYAVTITFKGKYSGTKTLYFNIIPSKTSKITPICSTTEIKASWKKVTGASGYKVELLNSKGKVVKKVTTTKTSYTFKKLSTVTTYKIIVTAYKTIDKKATYSTVSTTITTSTAPAKATLSKVTAGSKSATPAWKTVSGASGYQVQYSTSSKFKSAKTATVKKGSSKKTTIKKLTKGKKYYFKVRAYKTVDGKNVYGVWSAVKSVKIK